MADAALLIRWQRAVPGREQKALSLFGGSMEYYSTLQSEGAIESFEPVLLNPSTNDLTGFILIRGSEEQLNVLKQQERFKDMMLRGQYLIEGLGVIDGYLEGDLHKRMAQWAQVISE
jgi:hypothetical protein